MAKREKLAARERAEVRRLDGLGVVRCEIAARIGRGSSSVGRVLKAARSGVPVLLDWEPGAGRLDREDREAIEEGLRAQQPFTAIAAGLGCSPSTVSREVASNMIGGCYRASKAHKRAWKRSRRPKPTKLAANPELCRLVTLRLIELWSPEQISRWLRREFPEDPMMWVSHETIYQSLYVQGRGELRRELARCLRSGRARKHHGRLERRGRIPGMVMISDRPAEVGDRAVPATGRAI